ncbi:hypothetical protein CCH79_00020836, partial [Gambusia affinis]
MASGSDPPGSGVKSVRRSPRLSPQSCRSAAARVRQLLLWLQAVGGVSLQEVKRRGRMERSREEEGLSGRLKTLDLCSRSAASGTGLVYSQIFTQHQNLWDISHVESPDRVTAIMSELQRRELLSLCVTVEVSLDPTCAAAGRPGSDLCPREAAEEELLLAHTKLYVDAMRATQTMTQTELQSLSDGFDSVYLHP